MSDTAADAGGGARLAAGLIVRPPAAGEVDEVAGLVAAQNLADYGVAESPAGRLRARWLAADRDGVTAVAQAADGRLLGYLELDYRRPGRCDVALYLAGVAGAAAGAALLDHAAARAARPAAPAQVELVATVGEGPGASPAMFERAGFHRELSFLQMSITLAEPPPAADWPAGVTVRPFRAGQDEWPAYLADEEAAADKGYHTPLSFAGWAERMGLHAGRLDATLWFLAWAGDQVAGVALNWLDAGARTGWIDHLGVRRAWRRRGLGMALMRHSFGAFYERGVPYVRLNVDAASPTHAPALYQRAGMRTERRYHVYARTLGRPGGAA